MDSRTCLLVLIFTLCADLIASNKANTFCGGYDISQDPGVEARQLDGLWYSQGTISSKFANEAMILFQDQGRTIWGSYWNSTTKTCSYRKAVNNQLQSLDNGPFASCFSSGGVLPNEEVPVEWPVFFSSSNLLMYFHCFGKFGYDGRCSEKPFVRIMTRTLDISPKEKYIIDKRLRQFGESIHSVTFSNPRKNRCPRPMQKGRRRY